MSYHIYTTDGIILKRTPFGEANVFLHVLTRDLGLIIASARSARLSVSKLRPALQEYSLVSVSCIKGKSGWKITNVVEKGNYFFDSLEFTHRVLAQITSVLLKMTQGETPHKEIFQIVTSCFEYLRTIEQKDITNFEIVAVMRILHELGYVERKKETDGFLENKELWNEQILQKASSSRKEIISLVNKGLKESQL